MNAHNEHEHDMTRRYTFDDVGIPYDFEESDNDPSEEAESSSSSESARSKSSSSPSKSESDADEKDKKLSLPSRTVRARGRLDGRLQIPKMEENGACSWKTRDDNWILSKDTGSGVPFTYKILAPTMHKFVTTDKSPREFSSNVDRILENLYRGKLRGRVDGRLFSPDLQPQWATSLRRPRSPDTYEFKIASFHEHNKVNRMLNDILPKVRHCRPLDKNDTQIDPKTSENLKAVTLEEKHTPQSGAGSSKAAGTIVESVNANEEQRTPVEETHFFSNSESSRESSPRRGQKPNPLKQGNDVVKRILSSGVKEQQYRGRLDGRLYIPEEVDIQVTFTCTTSNPAAPNSPYQEMTFNDSLELENRLLPESVNIFQKKKKDPLMEPSRVRGRVDGRALALPRDAKWDFDALNISPRARADERVPHRIWRPCRIQELGEKVLPHSFGRNVDETVNDRPPSDEFPSSFDPDFIPEPASSVGSKPTDTKSSTTTTETRPTSSHSVKSSHKSPNENLSETEMDPGLTVIDRDRRPYVVRKESKRKPSPTHIIYRV